MKREPDRTPFDRKKKPVKQNPLAMPFLWAFCFFMTRRGNLKIEKVNMKGLKPPYVVFGTHHAFMDFCVTPMALFPHRANYISELEGFEFYGEWKYRQIGCLCKRKFTTDMSLIRNIKYVTDSGGIIVIYPEARYCNVGTSSKLYPAVGRLTKLLKVPVVVLNMKGNYLQSPIWNLTRRKVPLRATITQVLTAKEVETLNADEINQVIEEYYRYDEYEYQYDNHIKIDYEKRAEGIEIVLYQCPHCGTEYDMYTEGTTIGCRACGKTWHMTEYGRMEADAGATEFPHIPDWYEFQRNAVIKLIDKGEYSLDAVVRVEALPNAKNFIDLGEGRLRHKSDGFYLTMTDLGKTQTLYFKANTMFSVHTECNYRDKGQCITLSTLDNTYFIYPLNKEFNAVKIQFATEYLYELAHKRKILCKSSEA